MREKATDKEGNPGDRKEDTFSKPFDPLDPARPKDWAASDVQVMWISVDKFFLCLGHMNSISLTFNQSLRQYKNIISAFLYKLLF